MEATIKIGEENLKLKVTLGFYKNLSFPKSELNTINDNAVRLFEAIKLAIYFGNKGSKGWHCLADMEKEISDEVLEDIDDGNMVDKVSQAIFESYPDSLKKAIEDMAAKNDEDLKKK